MVLSKSCVNTIVDAIRDRRLFGASSRTSRLFLKAVFGLPVHDAELELFRHHTGRSAPREGGYPEAVAVVSVQRGRASLPRERDIALDVLRGRKSGVRPRREAARAAFAGGRLLELRAQSCNCRVDPVDVVLRGHDRVADRGAVFSEPPINVARRFSRSSASPSRRFSASTRGDRARL